MPERNPAPAPIQQNGGNNNQNLDALNNQRNMVFRAIEAVGSAVFTAVTVPPKASWDALTTVISNGYTNGSKVAKYGIIPAAVFLTPGAYNSNLYFQQRNHTSPVREISKEAMKGWTDILGGISHQVKEFSYVDKQGGNSGSTSEKKCSPLVSLLNNGKLEICLTSGNKKEFIVEGQIQYASNKILSIKVNDNTRYIPFIKVRTNIGVVEKPFGIYASEQDAKNRIDKCLKTNC